MSQFLPLLKQTLETAITTANTKAPTIYTAPWKLILMLATTRRDPALIARWFNSYWQKVLAANPVERTQLEQQLTLALKQSFKISPDAKIVNAARNTLSQIPLAQLSYSVLLGHYNQPVNLFQPIAR